MSRRMVVRIRACWILLGGSFVAALGAAWRSVFGHDAYATLLLAVVAGIHLVAFLIADGREPAEGFKLR